MIIDVKWTNHALKDLNGFDVLIQKRIVKKVDIFVGSESFHGVKRISGHNNTYRLRVGNYRVIFELIDGIVFVLKVGLRKNIY